MPRVKLPDGRWREEPEINIDPPPMGNVKWIVDKMKSELIKADNAIKAQMKGGEVLDCYPRDVKVKPFGDKWKVSVSIKRGIVIAHTSHEAREKGMKMLQCGPDDIEVTQMPESPNAQNLSPTKAAKDFDPWRGLRENVKASKRRKTGSKKAGKRRKST